MAEKRMTQAEKAAVAKTSKKDKTPAKIGGKQMEIVVPEHERISVVPARGIAAIVYIVLFGVFLMIAMGQQGFVLKFMKNLFQGLFGLAAFYVAIPGFLYLFIIQTFSGRQPVRLRTGCVMGFVVLCGCISHLLAAPADLVWDFSVLSALFKSGAEGLGGGVICGLVTEGLTAAFGTVLTGAILIISALLCLLAAFKITVPSLIRAIQERPRLDEEEVPERPEPAAVVVNHIAKKRIEHVEHKRRVAAERAEAEARARESAILEEERRKVAQDRSKRGKEMISQISGGFEETPKTPVRQPDLMVPEKSKTAAPRAAEKPKAAVAVLPDAAEVCAQVAVEPDRPAAAPAVTGEPVTEPVKETVAEPAPKPAAAPPKKVTAADTAEAAAEVAAEVDAQAGEEKPQYCFPPIDLLRKPRGGALDGTAEMRDNTKRLNETLASFKIEAHISNVTRGPSVTRYEVELEKGVRLNKLTTTADDIALSLGASGVRIAPVPGKISVVGIEVPNQNVTTVSLREVIGSAEFARSRSASSIAIGKDIGGSCIVGNIAKFPHMLIAGTTGSGKSVCMNSIIISLLYKSGPEDVKLIMIDPKMVELGIYNGIPHLLIPVVTDPKKAAGSLQWAVTEMMRRYRSMSDAGVRDLESYNSMIEGGELEGERLPQVVVIIDELADLMLVAAKEVEESICRIAQMGRAAGIHLIIATQRPSADVITGLMKANIPSRIAFSVASAMESRIILDTVGAEKLVGKGDMLYSPIGSGKPQRVQGCFVTDAEVEAVASFVKEHFASTYDQAVMDDIEKKAAQTGTKGASAPVTAAEPDPSDDELAGDEMLPAAVDVILETKQASVSMLQRRLKLGYARAARIVDEMEEKGIVGPFMGSKPRQILITKEEWELMKNGQGPVCAPAADEGVPDELL